MSFPVENVQDAFQKGFGMFQHSPLPPIGRVRNLQQPPIQNLLKLSNQLHQAFSRSTCLLSARCISRLIVKIRFREKMSSWDMKSPKPDESRDIKVRLLGWRNTAARPLQHCKTCNAPLYPAMGLSTEATIGLVALFITCAPAIGFFLRYARRKRGTAESGDCFSFC
jgi:hypothetical protein